MKAELKQISAKLKELHSELLEHQGALVEQEDGQRYGPYEHLQLAIHDPHFEWIRRLSEIITRIDSYVLDRRNRFPLDGRAVLDEVQGLINGSFPDFAGPYERALNRDPRLTITQVELRRALQAIGPGQQSA